MKKNFSVCFSEDRHEELTRHLLSRKGHEDLCFALWMPSEGSERYSALIFEVVLPNLGDRIQHGNVSYNPAYLERVLRVAAEKGAGVAFLHSHLTPGWQGMSADDVNAEHKMASSVGAVTGLPLVGLTLGTDGSWSARRWDKTGFRKFEPTWASTVRTVGDQLGITFNDSILAPPTFMEEFARTVSAWGDEAQARLMRLHVCVVGVGSVGSVIAEALAMMGVRRITLIDFDEFKRINRDRSVGVRRQDIGKSKVSVIARHLREVATSADFEVTAHEWSIIEPEGYRAALDADLIFCCVDRPWPRSVLNTIALAHLIPVVDGGIKVKCSTTGKLRSADWRAHTVAPGRRCMECIGQFEPSDVSLEREGFLDDPTYIEGLPKGHHLRRNENVFGFSLHVAGMEVMQALSLVIHPSGVGNIGAHHYHFVPGTMGQSHDGCDDGCFYAALEAKGDRMGVRVDERHLAAERARESRATVLARDRQPVRKFVSVVKNAWRELWEGEL